MFIINHIPSKLSFITASLLWPILFNCSPSTPFSVLFDEVLQCNPVEIQNNKIKKSNLCPSARSSKSKGSRAVTLQSLVCVNWFNVPKVPATYSTFLCPFAPPRALLSTKYSLHSTHFTSTRAIPRNFFFPSRVPHSLQLTRSLTCKDSLLNTCILLQLDQTHLFFFSNLLSIPSS